MFIDYKLNVVKLLDQINENDEEFECVKKSL